VSPALGHHNLIVNGKRLWLAIRVTDLRTCLHSGFET